MYANELCVWFVVFCTLNWNKKRRHCWNWLSHILCLCLCLDLISNLRNTTKKHQQQHKNSSFWWFIQTHFQVATVIFITSYILLIAHFFLHYYRNWNLGHFCALTVVESVFWAVASQFNPLTNEQWQKQTIGFFPVLSS